MVPPPDDDETPRMLYRVHAYGAICAHGGSKLVTDVSVAFGRKPNPGGRKGMNAEYREIAQQLLTSIRRVFQPPVERALRAQCPPTVGQGHSAPRVQRPSAAPTADRSQRAGEARRRVRARLLHGVAPRAPSLQRAHAHALTPCAPTCGRAWLQCRARRAARQAARKL
jgi:hypothetical protein